MTDTPKDRAALIELIASAEGDADTSIRIRSGQTLTDAIHEAKIGRAKGVLDAIEAAGLEVNDAKLRATVLGYLGEGDNPSPDYSYHRLRPLAASPYRKE